MPDKLKSAKSGAAQSAVPEDLVPVGHVSGAFGIQGWVKVRPYSADADALLHAKTWWLRMPDAAGGLREIEMLQSKPHGDEVVASLMGVADRNAAEALQGAAVQIRRSHFPPLGDDEFYWIDLIGLAVVNLRQELLGTVSGLIDNGAHPILRVEVAQETAPESGTKAAAKAPQELLIPFVDRFVQTVDQAAKKITVDWELDY